MRLIHKFGPAAALLFATGLYAQTTPGPTTGGTAPPGGPTTGGQARPGPMVIFPTDAARTPATTTPAVSFPTMAIQSPGVPRALDVTDRQQTQLDTFTQQLQARFQNQFDRLAGLPADQQAQRLELLNREFMSAWLDGARGVCNPNQLTRYQQLQLQFGGFGSLTDPVVQKALSLTPAQQAQLQQNMTWSQQQQAAIQQQALTDQARALQMFNTFNTDAQARMNQFLNANQQQAWSQLTGTPFAFQPMFPTAPTTGTAGTPATPGTVGPVPGVTPAPRPGAPGPTTGGTTPPGGPTTGGPARPGGPTTGGTAPGGPGTATPPKL
jgi:hypothetical protein